MRRNAKHLSARLERGRLTVIIPPGFNDYSVVKDLIDRARKELAPKLRARAPKFEVGRDLKLDCGVTFRFRPHPYDRDVVEVDCSETDLCIDILIGQNINLSSQECIGGVSSVMFKVAHRIARLVLLPRAMQLAAELGLLDKVRSWGISHGHKTLGTCSARGDIRISSACIFLSQELLDYIIYHELAHLSHHDHSPAFHALCDRYCSGREHTLEAALRTYPWPVAK